MNLQEQQLHYPLADTLPAPGQALTVAPGVKWIRMGLPFALNHINLWLLRDELDGRQGWTVVDCCIDKPESRAQWESVFTNALEGLPILRVLVTHMHPDHVGLAHWLCDRWTTPEHDCRLWMSATDYNAARMASQSTTGFGGEAAASFFVQHGLADPESVQKIKARTHYYPSMVPALPQRYKRLMGEQCVSIGTEHAKQPWRCIAGFGHAPEHIALYCEALGVLISGDMVLPRISTNVSVYDLEPESNPLQLFLDSLPVYAALPEATLVLPSHGKPFTGVRERIAQLQSHHKDRLQEVIQACTGQACTAADIVPIMFKRELDLHQLTFAMGEAVAHLHMLWFDGQLKRQRSAAGVFSFAV